MWLLPTESVCLKGRGCWPIQRERNACSRGAGQVAITESTYLVGVVHFTSSFCLRIVATMSSVPRPRMDGICAGAHFRFQAKLVSEYM